MSTDGNFTLLLLGLFVVAFLYSSVGHAGASGYIAVMTLTGHSQSFIKPTALVLNILVATLAAWHFYRAGYFSWHLFWPVACLSIPFSFLGGALDIPARGFKILLGIVLLFSAARFLMKQDQESEPRVPRLSSMLFVGASLGFLAGLTGTGGGIFLTPLFLFLKWARLKTVAAISAFFILTNSISGLLGNMTRSQTLPPFVLPLGLVVIVGGAVGSYLGSRKFSPLVIKRFLACVLGVAGLKLFFAI